jgi:hypothetical protein
VTINGNSEKKNCIRQGGFNIEVMIQIGVLSKFSDLYMADLLVRAYVSDIFGPEIPKQPGPTDIPGKNQFGMEKHWSPI